MTEQGEPSPSSPSEDAHDQHELVSERQPRAVVTSVSQIEGARSPAMAQTWPDTFLSVLTAPVMAFREMADPATLIDRSAIFGAALVVLLASLIECQANAIARGQTPDFSYCALSLVGDLTVWLSLAWVICFLSNWRSVPVDFKRALVLSGWAFLPVIFTGPCALFCKASSGWEFLLQWISILFVTLQILAVEALLKLGRTKMLTLLIVLPPLLFLVYIFWILLGGAMVFSAIANMLPFHSS